MLGVDQAVIGRVGLVEHREAARVRFPREAAAVDDGAAERRAVAAQEFRQRMDDDVGAVIDRPQQDRRRHGVVDDRAERRGASATAASASISQILPAGLPTLSQKIARVFSSISFSIASADRIRQSGH